MKPVKLKAASGVIDMATKSSPKSTTELKDKKDYIRQREVELLIMQFYSRSHR